MMTNLLLTEGDLLQVENVSLKVATFARFQPQSVDFLDITNPKAVYPLNFFATAVYIYSSQNIPYMFHVPLIILPLRIYSSLKFDS